MEIFRTGGGDKLNAIEFKELYEKFGIEHEVIVPYTPQHNGPAEKRNRKFLNMA